MRLLVPYRYIEVSMKGGIEKAADEVLELILPKLDALILVSNDSAHSTLLQKLQKHPKVTIINFANRPPTLLTRIRNKWHQWKRKYLRAKHLYWSVSDQDELGRIVEKYRATHCLYFFTRFQKPPQLSIPLFGVIHDLWWHSMPASPALIDREDCGLKEWLNAATKLICVSSATHQKVVSSYPHAKEKLITIPHGVTPKTLPQFALATPFGSAPNLFFYPAQFKANKRHIDLLNSAMHLARKGIEFKIVFTGQDTEQITSSEPLDNPTLEACRKVYNDNKDLLAPHIISYGYTSRTTVEDLYRTCTAVVLTSIYEGFGLPLIESISHGAPVICSNIDVFKEQVSRYKCGDWVQLFEPQNVEQLTCSLANFTEKPIARIRPTQITELLSVWTWRHAADAYVSTLQESH